MISRLQSNLPSVSIGAQKSPHCLTRNVTGEVSADDWRSDAELRRWRSWQELSAWARARGFVSGGGALPVGRAAGEGAHPRRVVPDDGLASQARGVAATRLPGDSQDHETCVSASGVRRDHQDALAALWEASDRVCGKRLVATIPPFCQR